jgi:hypothetical protein
VSTKAAVAALVLLVASATATSQARAQVQDQEGPPRTERGESPIDRPAPKVRGKKEAEPPPPPPSAPLAPRAPHMMWVGWNFGSGYGYQGAGEAEAQGGQFGGGFASGALGYFGPEFGYQVNEKVAVSLQTRHQVIPKIQPDMTTAINPHQWAHSVLARATYMFPFTRFQLYAGGVLGAGYFRFRTEYVPSSGAAASSDTIRCGPGVVGPVAGITFPFSKAVSAVGEFRSLVGFPNFGVMGDFSLGLQFDIGGL